MNRLLRTLAVAATLCGLLTPHADGAQLLPPAKKTARIKIIKGPELESASDYLTIIRWTANNPGGSDVHYGIVQYGTDPNDLSQTAKNPIRLNRGHSETVFRVRLQDLKPRTTYYYTVTSEEGNGKNDGVKSTVNKFTVPGPGQRIVAELPPPVLKTK
jgi:phosphodiesterase/alkaline phosphatase D-like protein